MAEILGLAASLVTITNLGTKLTRTLYEFATTVSSAREEIDYIGDNVSDYADILELLVEQLEHDRPIHSKKAIRLAERLYDRSHQLFDRIGALIPDKQRSRDHITFLARISWNFKKTRVHHLVGQLECLKRTVQLLVQVLSTARQFRAYRDHVGEGEERQKKQEKAHRQFLRTENVIVEWQRAKEKLGSLREASEHEDRSRIQAGNAPNDARKSLGSEEERSLIKVQGNTLAAIEAATIYVTGSESEKRAIVLQNTENWLEQLLDEWTVLDIEQGMDQPRGEADSYGSASEYDSIPTETTEGMDDTTGEPQSSVSQRPSTWNASSRRENLSPHTEGHPIARKPSKKIHEEHALESIPQQYALPIETVLTWLELSRLDPSFVRLERFNIGGFPKWTPAALKSIPELPFTTKFRFLKWLHRSEASDLALVKLADQSLPTQNCKVLKIHKTSETFQRERAAYSHFRQFGVRSFVLGCDGWIRVTPKSFESEEPTCYGTEYPVMTKDRKRGHDSRLPKLLHSYVPSVSYDWRNPEDRKLAKDYDSFFDFRPPNVEKSWNMVDGKYASELYNDRPALLLEYLPKFTRFQHVNTRKLAVQVLDSYNQMSKALVSIEYDLMMENILVANDRLVIIDFGTARVFKTIEPRDIRRLKRDMVSLCHRLSLTKSGRPTIRLKDISGTNDSYWTISRC